MTTTDELGGPAVHERNGLCQFAVATDVDAIFLVRQLLGYLPENAWEQAPSDRRWRLLRRHPPASCP